MEEIELDKMALESSSGDESYTVMSDDERSVNLTLLREPKVWPSAQTEFPAVSRSGISYISEDVEESANSEDDIHFPINFVPGLRATSPEQWVTFGRFSGLMDPNDLPREYKITRAFAGLCAAAGIRMGQIGTPINALYVNFFAEEFNMAELEKFVTTPEGQYLWRCANDDNDLFMTNFFLKFGEVDVDQDIPEHYASGWMSITKEWVPPIKQLRENALQELSAVSKKLGR